MSPTLFSPQKKIPSAPEEVKAVIESGALQHIGIIMDGNRRWAKQHGKLSVEGHHAGYKSLKVLLEYCSDELKLPALTVFAFSTENWKRPEQEVGFLFKLMEDLLPKETETLIQHNARLKFIGNIDGLHPKIQQLCRTAEAKTEHCTGMRYQVAWNYGGRAEIVEACKRLAGEVQAGNRSLEEITEDAISENLYTGLMKDPDMIIRTGGESRISNFLLWQSAYAEIFVSDAFWPDFTPALLDTAILEFQHRQRRFGK